MSAPAYTPRVGDTFTRGADVARVTMISGGEGGHVVALINGREFTVERAKFVALAAKTLLNGATLTNTEATP
jgi:hypothetical protein